MIYDCIKAKLCSRVTAIAREGVTLGYIRSTKPAAHRQRTLLKIRCFCNTRTGAHSHVDL